MTIFDLSVLTAAGIAMSGAISFLLGMSYQRKQDIKAMREDHDNAVKAIEEIRKMSLEAIDRAHAEVIKIKEDANEQAGEAWRIMLNDVSFLPFENDDINFGGF